MKGSADKCKLTWTVRSSITLQRDFQSIFAVIRELSLPDALFSRSLYLQREIVATRRSGVHAANCRRCIFDLQTLRELFHFLYC